MERFFVVFFQTGPASGWYLSPSTTWLQLLNILGTYPVNFNCHVSPSPLTQKITFLDSTVCLGNGSSQHLNPQPAPFLQLPPLINQMLFFEHLKVHFYWSVCCDHHCKDEELQALLDDDPTQTTQSSKMINLNHALIEKRSECAKRHGKVILLHDIAPTQISKLAKDTLKSLGWDTFLPPL